jgi:hypothetical protein
MDFVSLRCADASFRAKMNAVGDAEVQTLKVCGKDGSHFALCGLTITSRRRLWRRLWEGGDRLRSLKVACREEGVGV